MYWWWWLTEWRGLRGVLSGAAGVAAAVATCYLLWVEEHLPEPHDGWHRVAIGTVGIVAVCSAVARPLRIRTVDRVAEQHAKVADALRLLPWAIHEFTDANVPVRPIGASAWLIVRTLRGERLHRIVRERVDQTPGPSKIRWTKGKGVIGESWRTTQSRCYDAGSFDQEHRDWTATQWNQPVADGTLMGLSFAEYEQLCGKYGTVVAVPLTDVSGRKVIGVVALDAPAGLHSYLSDPRIIRAVADAAGTVARLVS